MQQQLLDLLRCPVTKTKLRVQIINVFNKKYGDIEIEEIKEALLFSETGLIFPVINGIPRMLVEATRDYADFIKRYTIGGNTLLNNPEKNILSLVEVCRKKNAKTKKSFAFEWSFLNSQKNDRLWHDNLSNLPIVFRNETGEELSLFNQKRVLDLGSGHGLMTSAIADRSEFTVGVELSNAVEAAYLQNQQPKAWFVQADLQFLPFEDKLFDILYSSGVIHHTNSTEQSLNLIEPFVKRGGNICLWLYHPQKSKGHNFILFLRKFTRKLPLKLLFVLLVIFVFPVTWLYKKIKNRNPPNWREEIIDLLDSFSPEFREEIKHETAIHWLQQLNYSNIKITTTNQFGFSITGKKS